MFVSEGTILNQSSVLRLRLSSLEGIDVIFEVDRERCTVDKLKIDLVSRTYGSDGAKLSVYYKLLHIDSGRILDDEQTLLQSGIQDNDELVLLKKRLPPVVLTPSKKDDTSKQPSIEDIENATANVSPLNTDRRTVEPTSGLEFQTELRKILVSLIDAAQKLICLNPAALKEAEKYVHCEKKSMKQSEQYFINPLALQRLVEMGFNKVKASKALVINRMSQSDAIQWLIDNESTDVDDQEPDSIADIVVSDVQIQADADLASDQTKQNLQTVLLDLTKMSGPEKVKRMLQAFQAYKRREFKPNLHALQHLMEMGFDEELAIDALRAKGNVQEEACDWLLNHEEDRPSEAQVENGLDKESTVYKAIMSNHVIQLALANPKTLIALLQILENPNTMQQWLNDLELSPMLLQISRIYHSDRYSQ